MDDPVEEIPHVIHLLTQSPPSTQLATLNRYFLPSASFTHPFVRTSRWDLGNGWNSRWAIARVYRWYKIMSPKIKLSVSSVAFDKPNSILYVSASQSFWIIAVAFLGYRADVNLVVRLTLEQSTHDGKYYIAHQEDLYQTSECAKFAWLGIWRLMCFWQLVSTFACILLAAVAAPVSWIEERLQIGELDQQPDAKAADANGPSHSWEQTWAQNKSASEATVKESHKGGID